jgi:hypothetical protein
MKTVVASRQMRSSSVRSSTISGSSAFIAIISDEDPQVKSSVCS